MSSSWPTTSRLLCGSVAGPYEYVREIAPERKTWFHHFRRVDDIRYYGDFVTNARAWKPIPTPMTIGRIDAHGRGSVFQLIREWLGAEEL